MALYERRASIQYGGHIQLPATTNSTALQLHTVYTDSRAYRVFSSSTTLWSGYNLMDALWTPDFAVSLLFWSRSESVHQDFAAKTSGGQRKPILTMDTCKKLQSPRGYNLRVIMTTFSRTLWGQPACQRAEPIGTQQTTVTCLQFTNPEAAPTSLFPVPSLTDSSQLHQKCPPRKGPLWRFDMVSPATSQQVQPQSVLIINAFKIFCSI